MQTAAQSPGDIEVAIVPFNTDVNVGTSYANATWLDWSFLSQSSGSWTSSTWNSIGNTIRWK